MTAKCEVESWAQHESQGAQCDDERLNKRLGLLLSTFGKAPGMSFSQACNGRHNEIAAAYRFFDNEATTPASILAAHIE